MDDPARWDFDRVGVWLEGLGLGHLVGGFRRNRVDGKMLMSLEKADLKEELDVQALSDRKLLWERIEAVRKMAGKQGSVSPRASNTPAATAASSATSANPTDRESPVYVPAKSSAPSSDRCEHCRKMFGIADAPVMLTLPGAARAARLHRNCKETWAYNNAKLCRHCKKPMTVDVTVLTGAAFGRAEVHPECAGAYERRHGGGTGGAPPRSPPSVFAEATSSAGPLGSCEQCHRRFTVADSPIKLTLPGATRSAELHPHCKARWSEVNAKRCDCCHEPMPTDITTLTGTFGKAEVHPSCVSTYEARLRGDTVPASGRRGSPGLAPSRSPRSTPSGPPGTTGKCEHCHKAFTQYDEAIVLTLPGASRSAELHSHCKTSWSRDHAKKCDFCSEPMIRDITTLSGKWGTAELHPDCVKGYETLNLHNKGGGPADRCSHCHRAFKEGEVANVVTLPGEKKTGKLHTECQNAWMMMQAKLCDHCIKPMPTDVTTLSGAWGEADVHPECVKPFKENLARGVVPRKSGGKSPRGAPTTSPRRTSPGRSPQSRASDPPGGYTGKMENRCYQCRKTFLPSEAVTVLSVSDLKHDAHLHNHCIDAFHRSLGHICTWCHKTISGHMTKLSGDFGKATLHPDCLLSFKRAKNLQ